jgi:hypothetical protein
MAVSSIGMKNLYASPFNRSGAKSGSSNKLAPENQEKQASSLRQMESQDRTQSKQKQSVVDQSISYASQLKASRKKAEKSSLEKKKLQYSYKKISSQIVRSKNSVTAKKAVQSAKREIMRLNRLKANGNYDEEELELAISHAKSMEKIAKKKVSHLEQEEMVERHKNGFSAALEEVEEKREESEEEEIPEEIPEEESEGKEIDEEMMADAEEYQYEMELQMAELKESLSENIEQVAESSASSVNDMMAEMSEEMMEMMEELDLTELAESTFAPNPNMSDEDLKMMKIKHRTKEMKEIAEADKIYLKGVIEHEKSKQASGAGVAAAAGGSPAPAIGGGSSNAMPAVTMPGGGGAAPVISGGFDVSI